MYNKQRNAYNGLRNPYNDHHINYNTHCNALNGHQTAANGIRKAKSIRRNPNNAGHINYNTHCKHVNDICNPVNGVRTQYNGLRKQLSAKHHPADLRTSTFEVKKRITIYPDTPLHNPFTYVVLPLSGPILLAASHCPTYLYVSFHSDRVYRGWPVFRLAFLFGLIRATLCFPSLAMSQRLLLKAAACTALFFLFLTPLTHAQLAAYTNLQRQLMVWDNGLLRKVDYLPPTDLKVGRIAIPYLDNSRSFKVYYGGGVRTLNAGFTNAFSVSDDLITFLNAKSLNVFDNGTVKNLSLLCDEYYLGDSLVVFLDGVRTEYKAYYNGQIYPIESFLAGTGVTAISVSDNIAAYNNYARQFRIFYHGEIIAQEDNQVSSFSAGRNTVAYTDAGHVFKIFHDGKTITAESFSPEKYVTGDNLVAYITNDGYFKVFYQDSIYNLGFLRADFRVGDNVVAFKDNAGYFKVFYKGEVTTLDTYYPQNFTIQYNSLVFVNRANTLRMFSSGEVYDVTTSTVETWDLNYDVLKYRIGDNFYRVFYNGQEY